VPIGFHVSLVWASAADVPNSAPNASAATAVLKFFAMSVDVRLKSLVVLI
jgi:hypothetical protein